MSTLHAFGDSYTYGMIEDWSDPDNRHRGRYPNSFIKRLAKHFNLKLRNHAGPGQSNNTQLQKLLIELVHDIIESNDLIFFAITEPSRDPQVKHYNGDAWWDVHDIAYAHTRMILKHYSEHFNRDIIIVDTFETRLKDKYKKSFSNKYFIDIALDEFHPKQPNGHPDEDGHKAIADHLIEEIENLNIPQRFDRFIYD